MSNETTIRELTDHMNYKEKSSVSHSKKLRTEIECIKTKFSGETLFTTRHNELLLSGALFTLQKIANIDSPINIKTLNTDYNVLSDETNPGFPGLRREHAIFGFVAGVGGSGDVFDQVHPVKFKERQVVDMIPFRHVPVDEDLDVSVRNKYSLKVNKGGYNSYFVKKFESSPQIFVEFDEPGKPPVPANVDELIGMEDKIINCYIQFVLKLNRDDIREYFITEGGGIRKTRVNSLGLVFGYPDTSGEYKGLRVFSKLNMNNEPFDNETKELTLKYKIYL